MTVEWITYLFPENQVCVSRSKLVVEYFAVCPWVFAVVRHYEHREGLGNEVDGHESHW